MRLPDIGVREKNSPGKNSRRRPELCTTGENKYRNGKLVITVMVIVHAYDGRAAEFRRGAYLKNQWMSLDILLRRLFDGNSIAPER
jgi:hypothetical protein